MKEERKALIDYRLEQADESLDSAQILFEHKKYRPSVPFKFGQASSLLIIALNN